MAIDKALIDQLLADYKKPEDIIGENGLLKQLTKAILERALQAELTDHLGFEKHDPAGHHSGNTRNGTGRKALKGDFGELELETPRDRQASFEPKIVAKGQTRFTGFDDKIISMYARGMSTREIQGHLEEIYGIEVSPTLISNITEAIVEEVKAWQSRPLEELYPIVYLDAMMVKMRDGGHVQNQAIYVVLGVDLTGQKEVLGLWVAQQEGSQILAASADRAKESRSEGYLHRLRGWVERISGSDRSPLSSHRGAALHRAFGAGFAELCALEAPQVGGRRSAADLSCGHGRGSPAESGGGNSEVERLSEPEPGVAAELGAHHAFFPLSRRHSQGDLYHQ
jgi:putative transposase